MLFYYGSFTKAFPICSSEISFYSCVFVFIHTHLELTYLYKKMRRVGLIIKSIDQFGENWYLSVLIFRCMTLMFLHLLGALSLLIKLKFFFAKVQLLLHLILDALPFDTIINSIFLKLYFLIVASV